MNAFAAESLASPAGRAAKAALPEERFGRAYLAGLAAAVAIHAAILFAWQPAAQLFEQAEFGVEVGDASVEVSLVAALPAEEPTAVVEPPPVPPPPEPVPPPPPPEPTPVVEPPPAPVVKAEMTIPTPEPAATPRPTPREKPRPQPKAAPNPATTAPRTARPVGDGSSAIPGNDATTARAAAGGTSKPGYLRNPHPAYPESARAARQEGVVMLEVNVDARGNVSSVRVSRSSGYAVLDERARSTVAGSWKFRPARVNGVEVATEVTVPIRFRLNR